VFTTGFKFFFGLFAAFCAAALVYGYTTGGNHVGPLSLGWKGGVGDHIGYGVLVGLAAVSLTISLVLVSFRDADASAQARLQNLAEVLTDQPVTASFWPVVASFGAGAAAGATFTSRLPPIKRRAWRKRASRALNAGLRWS